MSSTISIGRADAAAMTDEQLATEHEGEGLALPGGLVGVNWFVADECERRGLRSPKTGNLTSKGRAALGRARAK